MSGYVVSSEDAMQMAHASYVRGQHDVLLSLIDSINMAQESDQSPPGFAALAQQWRALLNGALSKLPPVPALPGGVR